jgi:hypothetical protein
MCYRREMSSADRMLPERTQLEVRWNQRFFWRNILFLAMVFLGCIAIAVFASGTFRLIGVAGAIVSGVAGLYGGGAGGRQIRRRPVAATLNECPRPPLILSPLGRCRMDTPE